jgi:hypothetical protein
MSSIALSAIALAFILGGALLGMDLRHTLPAHHLSSDTKDVVRRSAWRRPNKLNYRPGPGAAG